MRADNLIAEGLNLIFDRAADISHQSHGNGADLIGFKVPQPRHQKGLQRGHVLDEISFEYGGDARGGAQCLLVIRRR